MASINDLTSGFSDFLRPNLYVIGITPRKNFYKQDKNSLGILCHEATFPFYTFTTNSFYYNNKETHVVNKIDYDPATFNFYVDKDNVLLGFFDAWFKQIINENHQYGYYDDYVSEIEIVIMDRREQTSAIATLVDAFPINMESFSLGYAQNDAILNLQVSFQFKEVKYEFLKAPKQIDSNKIQEPKTWKDFITLGNIRRGVNMTSQIKKYGKLLKNPNAYDIIAHGRKIFSL